MRFIPKNPNTADTRKAFLREFAGLIASGGTIDNDVMNGFGGTPTATVEAGEPFGLVYPVTFDTPVKVENGVSTVIYLGRNSGDISRGVKVETKVKKGNLIFLIASEKSIDENPYTTQNDDLSAMLNELAGICTSHEVHVMQGFQEGDTSSYISGTNTNQIVGVGVLKDTQSEDYNAKDLLNVGYDFIMVDPNDVFA